MLFTRVSSYGRGISSQFYSIFNQSPFKKEGKEGRRRRKKGRRKCHLRITQTFYLRATRRSASSSLIPSQGRVKSDNSAWHAGLLDCPWWSLLPKSCSFSLLFSSYFTFHRYQTPAVSCVSHAPSCFYVYVHFSPPCRLSSDQPPVTFKLQITHCLPGSSP